jgi:hypothetical protein
MVALSMKRPFTVDKNITSAVSVGRPSVAKTHLFSTRESTLEKGLMSAVNVGNALPTSPVSLNIKEITL